MNYVIGDIQGCYSGLRKLLKKVHFDPSQDTLWPVGDLVARGEDSLSTLAFLYDLGSQCKPVLGNHDLHFLSVYNGQKKVKKADRLVPLLESKACQKYVDWLRHQPLARRIGKHILMVHAGLYPNWSFDTAIKLSREVESCLQAPDYELFLPLMYSNESMSWDDMQHTSARLTFVVNAMTRMRFLNPSLHLDFTDKGPPELASNKLKPWFAQPNKYVHMQEIIVFGHWASLMGQTGKTNCIGLDMGYVWGNQLRSWCVETGKFTTISA